jgi:Ca2+-binding RTX toxin-like protein
MLHRRNRKARTSDTITLNPAAFPAVYARARVPAVERLEQRYMLSVSATSLFGPQTVGYETDYESLTNGSETGTDVHRIAAVGTASFNGNNNLTEIDDTISPVPANGITTDVSKEYLTLDSGGLKIYGNVSTEVETGGTLNTTDTFAPAYISFPATLTAGNSYTATYTATSVSTGLVNSTTTTVFNYIVELTSDSTQSVTVPAGTFNAYVLNVSVQATQNGTTEPAVPSTEYVAAGVGNVKGVTVISESFEGTTINTTSISELTGTGSSVTVGSPAQLAFSQAPSTFAAGVAAGTPFTVTVEDADGNTVTTDTSNVTVALTTPNGATLGGTLTQAAVGGVATFSNLTVDKAGTYTLTATDGSLSSAVSTSFTVTSASFATLTNGNLLVEGTSGDDVITLQADGSGNMTATLNGVTSQSIPLASVNTVDVEAGAGNDMVTIESSMPATLGVSVQGGPGDDTIMGGPGNDTIGGGAGNDSLSGGPGDDSMKGGAGDDILAGGKGNDTLFGSLGNDTLRGALGDDSLNGGAGSNQLTGGQGNNTFYCVNGTDDQIFAGAATNDSLIYGTNDNYIIESGTIPPGNITLA